MDKVLMDLYFPAIDLTGRMGNTAESVATSLDYHHECNEECNGKHTPTLHIRVNDTNSGKGLDFFYTRKE
ncbi:MAG: hypothetical protein KAJ19_28205 [Gammaproteobacteria bacterium]|nr:hypothetical protein [Gammaproteobacteria bacterium]